MNRKQTRNLVFAATFSAVAAAGVTLAEVATATPAQRPTPAHTSGTWRTPNECIRANGGDYNACNVSNKGRGDLPYRLVHPGPWRTPNECIRANGGDYNACNIGNSGRGDLPYKSMVG